MKNGVKFVAILTNTHLRRLAVMMFYVAFTSAFCMLFNLHLGTYFVAYVSIIIGALCKNDLNVKFD